MRYDWNHDSMLCSPRHPPRLRLPTLRPSTQQFGGQHQQPITTPQYPPATPTPTLGQRIRLERWIQRVAQGAKADRTRDDAAAFAHAFSPRQVGGTVVDFNAAVRSGIMASARAPPTANRRQHPPSRPPPMSARASSPRGGDGYIQFAAENKIGKRPPPRMGAGGAPILTDAEIIALKEKKFNVWLQK